MRDRVRIWRSRRVTAVTVRQRLCAEARSTKKLLAGERRDLESPTRRGAALHWPFCRASIETSAPAWRFGMAAVVGGPRAAAACGETAMSRRAWLSLLCLAPPCWAAMFEPIWAVIQGSELLSRQSPVRGMAIASALCGF